MACDNQKVISNNGTCGDWTAKIDCGKCASCIRNAALEEAAKVAHDRAAMYRADVGKGGHVSLVFAAEGIAALIEGLKSTNS